ncbi:MAG TPA: diguanylate cyclase, partial [Bauldia sp.]|nr:diguanylate cyclase [Bauldia sp.]
DCAPAAAVHVAERIREAVGGEPVSVCGGRAVPLTTSIGLVAVTEPGAGSIDDLLARADAALYRAKAGGRDRWELDEPRRVGLAG